MRNIHSLLLAIPVIAAASGGTYSYRYWFDNLPEQFVTRQVSSGTSTVELDATALKDGFHTVCVSMLDSDGVPSSVATAPFIRFSGLGTGNCSVLTLIDGKDERVESVSASDGHVSYQLDVNDMPLGLHMLSAAVITESGAASGLRTAAFYRTHTATELRGAKCRYFIDGKDAGAVAADLSTGAAMIEIDVDNISVGLHELAMIISDGKSVNSPIVSKLFMKLPGGITEYRYWINQDTSAAVSKKTDSPQESIRVIDMWEIPEMPFRTEAFACRPDSDGSLTLHSQHDLTAMFICKDAMATTYDTRRFTDTRVSRQVSADEILPLTVGADIREALDKPVADKIFWRKFFAEPGYSVDVSSNRACVIDVFDPDGTKVITVNAGESTRRNHIPTLKSGTYHIALHDYVAEGGKLPEISYTYLPKYSVVKVGPQQLANSGSYFLTVDGNGFDKIQSLELIGNDAVISSSDFEVLSNTQMLARFDLDGQHAGSYSVRAEYTDTLGLVVDAACDNVVEVQSARKGEIELWYKPQARLTTPRMIDIEIRNTGNVPYYFIPINFAARQNDGCALSFMNFTAEGINGEEPEYYYTDNLLGTGEKGGMYAGMIPYLGPNETKVLTVGIEAAPFYWMYAWVGEPWSEEAKSILSGNLTVDDEDYKQSNMLSLKRILLMDVACNLQKSGKITDKAIRRRPAGTAPAGTYPRPSDDFLTGAIHDFLQNFLKEALKHTPFEWPGELAEAVSNLSVAHGKMIGGYVNMLQLRQIEAQMKACGLDLNDPNGANGQFYYLYEARDRIRGRIPSPGNIVANAFGQDNLYGMVEAYMGCAASCQNPWPTGLSNTTDRSFDPNDMLGYVNPSGGRHVGIGMDELTYTIEFENDPEAGATASALTVEVENQLDGNVFDLSTFCPRELTIGDKTVELPAEHSFVKTVDMRPQINTIAQVELNYDAIGGKALWRLSSLDPISMEPTDYFEQGLLPVNDSESHCGEGMITYSIGLKPGLADGTSLKNKAKIIFDDNDPIETPEWENITDYTLPTSQLFAETADRLTYRFTASGEDSGAGVWRYALYMRLPGEQQWRIIRDGVDSSAIDITFAEEVPAMTSFAVLATDGAGNVQDDTFMQLKLGDVDRSGNVDSNDVIALARHYMGLAVSIERFVSDINSDGAIDIQDALGAAHIYLQQSVNKVSIRKRKYPKR